ncbi:MAG: DUF6367 family protein [Syntrophobacteraceae bacterium]
MSLIDDYLQELEMDYIVVVAGNDVLSKIGFENIQEGKWTKSNKKGWSFRVDPESPAIKQQRHVHITKDQHINTKDQQVAWNKDGSQHDRSTFNQNVKGMETAKRIAKKALKLSDDVVLEQAKPATELSEITALMESHLGVVESAPVAPVLLEASVR